MRKCQNPAVPIQHTDAVLHLQAQTCQVPGSAPVPGTGDVVLLFVTMGGDRGSALPWQLSAGLTASQGSHGRGGAPGWQHHVL